MAGKSRSLHRGDRIEWSTSQGKTRGTVERKLTGTARVRGHTAKASPSHPQYEVRSEKTGKRAIHKPEALRKSGRRAHG